MATGFANAPISKGLIMTVCMSSLLFSVTQTKYQLHLQLYPHIMEQHQYWRLFVHHLGFTDSPDVFICSLILYTSSVAVERTFGSRKYAAFLAVTTLLQTGIIFLLLLFMTIPPISSALMVILPRNTVENGVSAAGPFSIVFAILYQYSRVVPDLWVLRIESRFWVGDRCTTWILAILLFFSQPSSTILPCLVGVLTSALYRSDLLLSSSLKTYRLPPWLYGVLSRILGPFIGDLPLPQRSSRPEHPPRLTVEERVARMDHFRQLRDAERENRSSVINLATRIASRGATFGRRQASGEPVLPTVAEVNTQTGEQHAQDLDAATTQPEQPTNQTRLRNYIMQYYTARGVAVLPPDEASGAINESAILALQAMFPEAGRANIVQALQLSDGSQGQAIERLLEQQRAGNSAPR